LRRRASRITSDDLGSLGRIGKEWYVDVRIGVTQAPRELSLELADDTDRDALRAQIDAAIAQGDQVLWLTDRRGRQIAVPIAKLAYVEVGPPDGDRRIGFGS
jgi:hypothetical protein